MTVQEAHGTKERILDAAETLFAEHGFAATSMRAITAEASVNLAAAHYHFGSKEDLLDAVLRRRLEPLNRMRLEALGQAFEEAGEDGPTLEAVLRCFFEPPFHFLGEMGEAAGRFIRLAGRAHTDPEGALRQRFLSHFDGVVRSFLDAFSRVLPEVEERDLHWRIHFMVGSMAHVLAWSRDGVCTQWFSGPEAPERVADALVAFCAAGMRAPARPEGDRR